MKHVLLIGIVLGWTLLPAREARAFQTPSSYGASASIGGGGERYFTGAPRWRGYDCTICHVDAATTIAIELASTPADLFVAGSYQPGTTYTIDVTLTGEHLGFAPLANPNTFVLEIAGADGAGGQGVFGGLDSAKLVTLDGGRVLAATGVDGEDSWTFQWTAPPAGAGPLGLFLGAVDGDGANDTAMRATDALGDDVFVHSRLLCEANAPCGAEAAWFADDDPEDEEDEEYGYAALGCGVTTGRSDSPQAGALLIAMLALAGILVARRRVLGLLALLLLAGCHDPTTPAECPDRICGDAPTAGQPDAGGPACLEDWVCGPWEPAGADTATRACTDENMVGTTVCKPPTGPLALPALDMNYFKCNVEPIFDRGCSMQGCHGTETGRAFRVYSRGRLRNSEIVDRVTSCLQTGTVDLSLAATGTVMCEGWLPHTATEWQKNFDNARSFMVGLTDGNESELLTQAVIGGKFHAGVHLFAATDPDYLTIRSWLEGATLPVLCDLGGN